MCRNPKAPELYYSVMHESKKNDVFGDYSSLPRPTHNAAIMLCGSGIIQEGDRTVEVREGELLFIPKYARYTLHWIGAPDIRFHTIHFDFVWQKDPLRGMRIPVQKLTLPTDSPLYADYEYLHEHQYDQGTEAFAVVSRFYGMCHTLFGMLEYNPAEATRSVQPALDFIEMNFRESIRVRDLAQMCCLSESRFYTCFKQETGVSPIQYKNILSIQHVMYALVADPERSIETLSEEYGFESTVYFRRLFKRITGITPGKYRRAQMRRSLPQESKTVK